MTKKDQAKPYTVISVDSAAWGFSPAGSDVLSADVLSTKVLSDLIHSWALEHAPMLPPVVARGQQSPKNDMSCMDLERKQRIVDGFVEAKPRDNNSQISASPNQCRHHRQLLLVHERHNSTVVPSAIWTKREKQINTAKATYHGCELSTMQKRKTASKKRAKNCAQMRPRKPTYLKRMSLVMPPRDLANRFMRPKAPAKADASAASIWK